MIPRSLQAVLPFKSKPKVREGRKKTGTEERVKAAVVVDGKERQIRSLLTQVQTLKKEKMTKRREKAAEKRVEREKAMAREAARSESRQREERRDYFKQEDISERKRQIAAQGGGKKRARSGREDND
ncbi:hypothetical protein BJ684DRAFT_21219 [Piptocephalis cylindrospora]|uniref:Uncharacterized protein n=1 Tax=Piptocephalis cylindrospora TaxID=1907219 RepID=A0A4P9Y0H8_9FUNG|nr:hypothetical protein BJ684DRAFT_21219 [Piptocephalis cylindrospora]|eukprot:RKP12227.1 hypothetical protein BJ684DRAFT_21219 [Piptocephalis cylindrospora]